MITIRKAADRGVTDAGWLKSYHTFSFNNFFDPEYSGFRSLRVINDDWVERGKGFGMHGHKDMEIVTLVLEGAIEHRDSLGNGSVLRPGEVQRMTAGTGIRHSEFNPSPEEPLHLLQIWIEPQQRGLKPSYDQKPIPQAGPGSKLRLAAAPAGRGGAVEIHQDAEVSIGDLSEGEKISYPVRPGRHVWLQIARGNVTVGGEELHEGDGAAVSGEPKLEISGGPGNSEVVLFDLN